MQTMTERLKGLWAGRPRLKLSSGIQRRWIINNLSLLLLSIFLFFCAFIAALVGYYYANIQSGLEAKAKATSDFFESYISLSYNDYYRSVYQYAQNFEEKNTLEMQFLNRSGTIVVSSFGLPAGLSPGTSDIAAALDSGKMDVFIGRDPGTRERIIAVSSPLLYSNGEVIGVLRFVSSLKIVDRQILLGCLMALVLWIGILVIVSYNSRYFLRSIVEPVREISATAKRIASGSYGVQIQKKFDDEIGELADTINEMSIQIGQAERMQTEFISSVSHELRTPLTAIAGWGETLLTGDSLDEETRRGIRTILGEANRLTKLVEELLEFTRMQDGRFKIQVQMDDIRAAFEETVFVYGSRLRQEGIQLDYLDNDDEIPEIMCDAERMKQVFLNLLDNAAKHGGEGKRIVTSLGREGAEVVIRIRDFGPGIPEDELPHVKKKFYKGSSKARGSGIGLAVCDEIVTMHNGSLTLENAEGGGTLVTIRLPVEET